MNQTLASMRDTVSTQSAELFAVVALLRAALDALPSDEPDALDDDGLTGPLSRAQLLVQMADAKVVGALKALTANL